MFWVFCVRFLNGSLFSRLMAEPERIADGLYVHNNRVVYFTSSDEQLYFGKFISGSDCIGNIVETHCIFENLMCALQLIESTEYCKGRYWSAEASIPLAEKLGKVEGLMTGEPEFMFYGRFKDQILHYASSVAGRQVDEAEAAQMIIMGDLKFDLVDCEIIQQDERTTIYSTQGKPFMRYIAPCWYGTLPENDNRISDAAEVYTWVKMNSQEAFSSKGKTLSHLIMDALNQSQEIRKAQQRRQISEISRLSDN